VQESPTPRAETEKSAQTHPALTVTLTTPKLDDVADVLKASGNISAWQEAVISTEIGGLRLVKLLADVGDSVKKGQLLARYTRKVVAAEYAQAKANARHAVDELERALKLIGKGGVSKAQLQAAKSRRDVTRAQLTIAAERLAQTEIRAPDDGMISARRATLGAVSGVGQELFRLIRQNRLEWRAELTAAEAARVRPGMKATVRAEGVEQAIVSTVRSVAPSANTRTRNIIVYADLPATPNLRAGAFANGEFNLGRERLLTLPQRALLLRDGFSFVFIADGTNHVSLRKIKTGQRFGRQVVVVSGLSAEERVVLEGAGFLNEGDLVRVVD